MEQKILAGSLNEEAKTGSRTRLLRIGAGVFTTEPLTKGEVVVTCEDSIIRVHFHRKM